MLLVPKACDMKNSVAAWPSPESQAAAKAPLTQRCVRQARPLPTPKQLASANRTSTHRIYQTISDLSNRICQTHLLRSAKSFHHRFLPRKAERAHSENNCPLQRLSDKLLAFCGVGIHNLGIWQWVAHKSVQQLQTLSSWSGIARVYRHRNLAVYQSTYTGRSEYELAGHGQFQKILQHLPALIGVLIEPHGVTYHCHSLIVQEVHKKLLWRDVIWWVLK